MTSPRTADARIAALEAENAELRERLEWYRLTVFGEDLRFPLAWRLTPTEARLLAALLSPLEYMTHDALMSALYGGDNDEPHLSIIGVLVYHLRRKLRPHDIQILSVRGCGFMIPRPRRDDVRRALRLVSSPPWEHRAAEPSQQPRTAARFAAQDRFVDA